MLAKVYSHAVLGIDAYRVDVEVDITYGQPFNFQLSLTHAECLHILF